MGTPRYAIGAAFAACLTGCALNTQQEMDVGRQYSAELAKELPIVHDSAIQADLDAIGAQLTPYSRRPEVHYRFFLVNSSEVNAFAVPGGYVYVTREIIEHMTGMDQLAGVLGHEMGHVELRHSAKQIGRQQTTRGIAGLASVLLGDNTAGRAASAGANLAGSLVLAKYSRDQERDADRQSIVFTTAAGINPMGIADFFRILKQVEGSTPDKVEQFFASHPLTEDRITDVTERIAANPQATAMVKDGRRDSPVFEALKAAVHRLPPPPDARPHAG